MAKRFLILGIGNPLFGNDGFGQAVIEVLAHDKGLQEFADIEDAGTDLLNWIEKFSNYDVVVVVDVALSPDNRGNILVLDEKALAEWQGLGLDAHAFSPVIALALFRQLFKHAHTILKVVVWCTDSAHLGCATFEQHDVIAAANVVRQLCLGSSVNPRRQMDEKFD